MKFADLKPQEQAWIIIIFASTWIGILGILFSLPYQVQLLYMGLPAFTFSLFWYVRKVWKDAIGTPNIFVFNVIVWTLILSGTKFLIINIINYISKLDSVYFEGIGIGIGMIVLSFMIVCINSKLRIVK